MQMEMGTSKMLKGKSKWSKGKGETDNAKGKENTFSPEFSIASLESHRTASLEKMTLYSCFVREKGEEPYILRGITQKMKTKLENRERMKTKMGGASGPTSKVVIEVGVGFVKETRAHFLA
ncbi:uncharacterized protein HKW66_Vig0148870 [Vigna angularis]|uniref:Uncharacterized protein n=1 Tax=Phaseolus angularis TaxID=3914 RepID=A0A8T0JUI9_PHAAN|nr:uncharacterized protein HKW66_Vig0148870 [Vigna angularis]